MSASFITRPLFAARDKADKPSQVLPQDVWIRRCAVRLRQLRPQGETELVERVADELWQQVSRFNPEIAAELEHESGYWEH